MRSKKYFRIGGGGGDRWWDMKTIGAPIPHLSKPNDWWILAQAVKAHKASGPWTLEEYEHYLRGSPVTCHMSKFHTMATRSKVLILKI